MIEGEHIVGDTNRGTRKRKINTTSKERKREIRYSNLDPDLLNFKNNCDHRSNKFECMELLLADIKIIRQNFYNDEKKNKNAQDNKLAQMMNVKEIKRQRKRKNGKSHEFHTEFYVWHNRKKVFVCQKLFSSIFNCGPRRIHTIVRKKMQGIGIKDNRGGDRKSKKNALKLESVMKFVSSLRGHESHYGRGKSRRIYLSSELNIKKLWKMYNHQVQDDSLQTNYKYFSRIFSNKFNIVMSNLIMHHPR
ncbi:unnamed protein product [Acanthoscelides obtectus]|uniref:Uncharacterized protein n=1 Tax=Acanthoscelides obtectus TaxID=200917 RepID=A0A9P0Q8Y3_ACAOB|nr:unnamed protein product [Acanthoscelides obtectus]CAK1652178.1 hypothetical protein AOBTE_LOCUS17720 [Acanthoscelides obtectus]